MKDINDIQNYFNEKYYNQNKNYNIIMSEILKTENQHIIRKEKSFNFFKVIATTVITLLGTTGIVFAGVTAYNEYIKKQDELKSNSLYLNDGKLYSNDFTEDMIYEKTVDLYYKVITNISDYNKYKHNLSDLPELTSEEFNSNFLIIIGNWGSRYPHENDLEISRIDVNDETTSIILKQKENPNYDKNAITLYAIIDKSTLKQNIKLCIEQNEIKYQNYVSIENLPNDYSIEEAQKDGCFVEENSKVLSDDVKVLDNLIENAKSNIESFVRIYSKSSNSIRIIDLQYKNGIFIANVRNLKEKEVNTFSFKYLTKREHTQKGTVEYGYNMIDRSEDAGFLLEISY